MNTILKIIAQRNDYSEKIQEHWGPFGVRSGSVRGPFAFRLQSERKKLKSSCFEIFSETPLMQTSAIPLSGQLISYQGIRVSGNTNVRTYQEIDPIRLSNPIRKSFLSGEWLSQNNLRCAPAARQPDSQVCLVAKFCPIGTFSRQGNLARQYIPDSFPISHAVLGFASRLGNLDKWAASRLQVACKQVASGL